MIDNLANELDAILANADGDMINDTKNKDKKRRNKMRRSIISMDYLEDLSLLDDDNDDKKLLWKSTPDSTDINNANTVDTIDHVQTNETNCNEVSNTNDNTNDENKILENVTDVFCPLESNENIDVDVITAEDLTDSIGINIGDDFTHEVVIPTDDHDEIAVPVEEYIEHSAVLTSTDSLVSNSDSFDITATTANTIDLYDSCITIGNDISNNEDDHDNAENVDIEDVHSHDQNNFETDNNNITDNKTLVVENNDMIESYLEKKTDVIASIDGNEIASIDGNEIANIDEITTIDGNEIAAIDEIATTDNITNYITNTEEYHSNEECKEFVHNETIETIETKAFMRLNIRFEQARWKYQWELVSYYAALQARKNKLK